MLNDVSQYEHRLHTPLRDLLGTRADAHVRHTRRTPTPPGNEAYDAKPLFRRAGVRKAKVTYF